MNKHLKNLNKIEFVITYACSGRCKHCSEGDHEACGESIDVQIAADAVRRISAEYDIKTVMTFGGEPLLCPDAVYEIMRAAKELDIPKRQVITNGYFSNNESVMAEVATRLAESGANDLLLSVDAFHQEFIPFDIVKRFAELAKGRGIPIRLQPAWLQGADAKNPYNEKTKEVLESFSDLNIPIGEGNVIFPEGNALKYLADYFKGNLPENPYAEDPCNVKCISFEPNGNVLGGNVYRDDVMEILNKYRP